MLLLHHLLMKELNKTKKVLMVCLGNICRSPLAHGLLQQKVEEKGLNWIVDSAGTGAYHVGQLPDSRSIEIAAKHNLDITNQRARQFVKDDFENFDLIFAMDASNYNNILSLTNNQADKDKVLLLLNESHANENRQVPDPYYGGESGFKDVYDMIDLATDCLIERLA